MFFATHQSNPSRPPDICLLLRAHAEHRWLTHEVVPVLRQLEQRDSLPEEQLGAALAYLEVLWIEASQRAAETDRAYAELDALATNGDRALHAKARSYHAAVHALRSAIARHVSQLLAAPSDTSPREPVPDRYASS
jgi:hypothetical protein